MTEKIYPFPSDVKTTTARGWQFWKARLFGEKYHEFHGELEIKAYYYKGVLYITRYGHKGLS